jgi:hypothetical protein
MMLYRVLLRLYPRDFLRRYGAELEADFEDAWDEAAASGRAARLAIFGRALGDVARSAPREWLRTPWPAVAVMALLIASAVFYGVVLRVHLARGFSSETAQPESPALFALMAAMLFVPVAAMLVVGLAARVVSMRPRKRGRV